jgi:saccharopine dehydrogenase (NADP+, L-glutamate forming)
MKEKKRILVLGSGMVSRPGVAYLLGQQNLTVTVASNELTVAQKLVQGHKNGTALFIDVKEEEKLETLIKSHDIVISLLPWVFHVVVARLCVKHNKSMATSSYASQAMRNLDPEARKKGLLFLNEMGADPGVDHMSAMKVIDGIAGEGGKVLGFYSFCGGLPAPGHNGNPFRYKFSWSPQGVLLASKNSARFLENGKEINIDGNDLFLHYRIEEVEGLGTFEVYPNRDSLPYKDLYHLKDARTVMRGTYRYPGWCATLKKIVDLGLVDQTPVKALEGVTYKQMMANRVGAVPGEDVLEKTAAKCGLAKDDPVIKRLEWLGLFSAEPVPGYDNHLDILSHLMQRKLAYREGEKDMLLLKHTFIVENKDKSKDRITSTLIEYGTPGGDTSMARAVSLPLAIGVKLMAAGKIPLTGVRIPNEKEIYVPVLNELGQLGIELAEQRVSLKA